MYSEWRKKISHGERIGKLCICTSLLAVLLLVHEREASAGLIGGARFDGVGGGVVLGRVGDEHELEGQGAR